MRLLIVGGPEPIDTGFGHYAYPSEFTVCIERWGGYVRYENHTEQTSRELLHWRFRDKTTTFPSGEPQTLNRGLSIAGRRIL